MTTPDKTQEVDLEKFAQMAGFPLELVKKELFGDRDMDVEVSLEELRMAMLNYLDDTMLK